eukprot:8793024-Pyramimonas_sp.AAC.1
MPPRAGGWGCLEREGGATPPGIPPLPLRTSSPWWCWCRRSLFLGGAQDGQEGLRTSHTWRRDGPNWAATWPSDSLPSMRPRGPRLIHDS